MTTNHAVATATAARGACPRPGGGVEFSVWAPHAQAVSVVGDFNQWQREATPLEASASGVWSGIDPAARTGGHYRYELLTADGWVSRIDPHAREVTHSMGDGVIHDPLAFDWGGDVPGVRPWHEMVIYEMHVGTVARKPDAPQPGTFDEAIGVLDHVARLGVTDVQLMPVAEFAGDRSWGYNPACPFAVESAYGGPA